MTDNLLNIYDSELLKLEKVKNALIERQGVSGTNLEAFRKEAIERFAEVGFKVDVKVFETDQEGLYAFEFDIIGRSQPVDWDQDRMVHEVTSDILELGEGGVIPTNSQSADAGHRHGEGHHHH